MSNPTRTLILLLEAMVEEREIGHEIKDDGQVLLDAQDVYAAIRAHASNEVPGSISSEISVIAFPVEACIAEMEENYQAYMKEGAVVSASVMNLCKGIVSHYADHAAKREAQPAGAIPADIKGQNMALVPLMVMAASDFDNDALGVANLDRLMTDALSAIRPYLREPKRESGVITCAACGIQWNIGPKDIVCKNCARDSSCIPNGAALVKTTDKIWGHPPQHSECVYAQGYDGIWCEVLKFNSIEDGSK